MADQDDRSPRAVLGPPIGAAGPEVDGSAVGVAACRALESSRPDALYVDPYASALAQEARPTSVTTDAAEDPRFVMMSSYLAVRNRLFGGYLSTRESLGSGQWVLLGGGLDTRAYRLAFAPDASVFELDRGATPIQGPNTGGARRRSGRTPCHGRHRPARRLARRPARARVRSRSSVVLGG